MLSIQNREEMGLDRMHIRVQTVGWSTILIIIHTSVSQSISTDFLSFVDRTETIIPFSRLLYHNYTLTKSLLYHNYLLMRSLCSSSQAQSTSWSLSLVRNQIDISKFSPRNVCTVPRNDFHGTVSPLGTRTNKNYLLLFFLSWPSGYVFITDSNPSKPIGSGFTHEPQLSPAGQAFKPGLLHLLLTGLASLCLTHRLQFPSRSLFSCFF